MTPVDAPLFIDAAPAAIVFKAEAGAGAHRDLTLGDVADVTAVPATLRAKASAIVLVPAEALARGRGAFDAPTRVLIERARAAMPALSPLLPAHLELTVVRVRIDAPATMDADLSSRAQACVAATRHLDAGETPLSSDLVAAPCVAYALPAPMRYDAGARTLVATRAIAAGAVMEAPPAALLALYPKGAPVALSMHIGAVRVTREATALAPIRPGHGFFARTGDGAVLSAPPLREGTP